MKRYSAVVFASLLFACPALASSEHWTSGFGQGNYIYRIENGPGNEFIVNCDEGATMDHSWTGILVNIIGRPPTPNSEVRVILDGEEFRLSADEKSSISANCHACSDNFVAVWGKLRKAKSLLVQLADGRSSNFSLKGAAKALGPKACRTGFMGK